LKDDRIQLTHIIECIEWIERFASEGYEVFLRDRKTRNALLRDLQTLAESTQRLSRDLKKHYPDIPWASISGFRNVLVHDYLGLKYERIWRVIVDDLPALKTACLAMLAEAEK
jgi:uncharacterized protein with HEPN domain